MSNKKTVKIQFEVKVDKLLSLGIALLSFIFLFVNWFKYSIPMLGYSSSSFSIFGSGVSNISTLMEIGKIFATITIIAFIIYVASYLISFKELIPSLKKVDVDKYVPLIYFGIYALALIFSILGIITTDYVGPTISWFFATIICAFGFVISYKPDIIRVITKK